MHFFIRILNIKPIPFAGPKTTIKHLSYVSVFLIILYVLVSLFADSEVTERNNLFTYSILGFVVGYYIFNPIFNLMRRPTTKLVPFFLAIAFIFSLLTFRYNSYFVGALKWVFLASGSLVYIYLKFVLFMAIAPKTDNSNNPNEKT